VGEKAWVIDDETNDRFPLWTRGNVGEVFPTVVTPMTWSLFSREVESGWRDALARFGALEPDDYDGVRPACIGVFGGYAYLNVSLHRILAVRTPGLSPPDMDRSLFGESEAPPYEPRAGDKSLGATLKVARTVARSLGARRLGDLDADKEQVTSWLAQVPDAATADDERLLRTIGEFASMFRRLFGHHIHTTFAATIPIGLLNKLCAEQLGDPGYVLRLLGGIGDVESAEPAGALWELGRLVSSDRALGAAFDGGLDGIDERLRGNDACITFVRRFDAFRNHFGARGPNEWEASCPTYGTDARIGLAAIDCLRRTDPGHDPAARRAGLAADRADATAEARARLRRRDRPMFDRALRASAVWSQGRERSKTTVIRALHAMRLAQRELARRARERGGPDDLADFWLLTAGEVGPYLADPASFGPVLAERRARADELAALEPPFVFVGAQADPSTWVRRGDTAADQARPGDVLHGIGGCPGVARGRARVVLDPADPCGLAPGDVLIAPITDPSWTPLFVPAEAVVVDVGAQMSHAVIVSRELGIPCVVSVTGATRRVPDGALVEVDGGAGTVRVLDG
jgi:phosphohistidine swiveling domain-containing protein